MKLNILGINTYYQIQGKGQQDILLLHGWASSCDVFSYIIKHFEDRFRIITLDFPGCGKTALPKQPLTLEEYGEFVLEFMREAGVKNPIFIGHSNGGRVILYLAGNGKIHPEKIVLFDSAGIKPKKTLRQKFRLYSFKTIRFLLTLPLVKNYTGDLLEKARSYYGSSDYKNAPEVMRKTLVNLVNVDLRHLFPNIRASTLLIWGEKDTSTPPADAQIMEKGIPDSGLCMVKGAGHFPFLDDPGLCNSILDSFIGGDK